MLNSAHIVLVDDDDVFREMLRFKLIDEGYEVTSFSSGGAALEHFAAGGTADVVLLDWRGRSSGWSRASALAS
jgi:two-component system response regulator ChvI